MNEERTGKYIAVNQVVVATVKLSNCSNAFFSETTNMIKAKLYMNWMVLYKLYFFYSDMKWQLRQDLV
jgi:hypothetical protein